MRRSEVGLALCLATVLGVIAGLLLFAQAGPFPLFVPASPSGSPSHHSDPSASPSPSPSGSPSKSSVPPFTKLALLQADNFDTNNWKDTEVLDTWDAAPSDQITSCTDLRSGDGRPLAVYGATYVGRVTTAAEIVMRFAGEKAAKSAMKKMATRIEKCQDQPDGDQAMSAAVISAPTADPTVEVQIWETTGRDDGSEGVVGLVRAGDRLAFLTMRSPRPDSSEVVDPRETTYIDALYVYAGRRLI